MTVGVRRRLWPSWSAVAAVIVLLLPALDVRAVPPAGPLRSFYIATGPSFHVWSRQIVTVEPVGRDARVRVIHVAAVNEYCPEIQLVTAAERLVPDATVQAVARV